MLDDGVGFDVDAPAEPGHVGLVIVRGVLAERGGTLRLTSTPGSGTAATVRVPVAARTSFRGLRRRGWWW